jgi:peptide/nickel transport system substrate-binding protein
MTQERTDVGVEPDEPARPDGRAGTTGFRAFLLSDIRGYSTFAAVRGDEAAAELTERFIAVAERVLGQFGGESIGNRGDEVLFAFESPRQAIRAAAAFEEALLEATREDPSLPMPAGVGIDVGEAVVVPDGWRANAINVAARLCSVAKGGEILATREATHLAQAVDGVRYAPRPATRLKGIAEPVNPVRVASHSSDTARGFAELGFTHAEAPPARRRSGRRVLPVVLAAALVAIVAIVVVLVASGSSSVRLTADDVGAIATGTGQVALSLPVTSPPTSVAVGKDGAIWVASAAAGSVSRIDPNTHAVTNIAVGSQPVALTVAPSDGSIWVANSGDGTVSRISPETDHVVGTYRVGAGPSALVATDNAVWVANTLNASVSKIDLTSNAIATFPVGSEPAGIAAGAGSVWVADQGDATVYRLDQQTGKQDSAPITVGNGPTGMAYGDGAAWVVNSTDGTLSRIDSESNAVTTIPVGQGPYDVAVGAGHVWVSDEYGNAIKEVDPVKLTVTHTTDTNSAPLGLALAGDRLWVATDGSGSAAHRGGVLYALASGTDFSNQGASAFDPGSVNGVAQVLVMTGDGLVAYRRDGGVAGNEPVPDLAVALPAPTDNGLTYTFHIRAGVRYSNGVPVRASDFRRGLERAFKLGDPEAPDLGLVVGAQHCVRRPATCDLSRGMVADDATNTVTVHVTKPDPDLFAQLTLPAAYPVPPGTGIKPSTATVPGTGAYEISDYRPADSKNPHAHGLVVLTRNPYFHQWSAAAQPTGFPNRIVVRTNYSPAQQVTAVGQGRADLAWDPPPQGEITGLSQNFASQLHANPFPETTWLWLNARSAPFDNVLARRAVDYALDRGALSRAATNFFDRGRPTCQMLPPTFPGYVPYCPYTVDPTPSQRWVAPDLAKAQTLVHQSGTFGDRVALVDNRGVDGPQYTRLLAAALSGIGYRVRTREVSDNNYFGRPPRFYARFQAGVGNWSADYVASSQFFAPLIECSAISTGGFIENLGGFCDHSLDASIATALSSEIVRPGIASQQWAAIDRKVADLAPVIPISNSLAWDFVARRVGNYQYNPQWGVLVDQLWVR